MSTNYWIGVVSESHVERGVDGGFAQLCHGKVAALKRMKKGDGLIYYSPKTDLHNGVALQQFTAIGRVVSDIPYQVTMAPDFFPFRHDIEFYPCQKTSIQPLIDRLSFIPDKRRWGYPFRFGHIAVPAADFFFIAHAMQADYPNLDANLDYPTQMTPQLPLL